LLPNAWLVECRNGRETITIEQVLNSISALPPSDQLRIVRAIWDRLPEGVRTELSAAQQAELDRRWADYKADPSSASTEDEFREHIRIDGNLVVVVGPFTSGEDESVRRIGDNQAVDESESAIQVQQAGWGTERGLASAQRPLGLREQFREDAETNPR
jgi:putative addiction module component (TIGR02574 family)